MRLKPERSLAVAGLALAGAVILTVLAATTVLGHRPPGRVASGLCAIPHVGASDCRGAP